MTCGSTGYQAAREYSLIRPPRTGFRSCRCAVGQARSRARHGLVAVARGRLIGGAERVAAELGQDVPGLPMAEALQQLFQRRFSATSASLGTLATYDRPVSERGHRETLNKLIVLFSALTSSAVVTATGSP